MSLDTTVRARNEINDILDQEVKEVLELAVIDYKAVDASFKFSKSLHEIGFAVIKNHGLDHGFIQDVYKSWEDFFTSTDEVKADFEFESTTHDGFVSFDKSETAKGNNIKDLKMFYHFYKWGRCPDFLKEKTDRIYNQLEGLACDLLGSIEQYLPANIKENLCMPLSKMVKDSGHSLLRPIYYPSLNGSEPAGAIRSAPHEDIDMITLIAAPSEPGLQVKNKAGNWIDVPCDPAWLVINSGDMLDECTNGFYPSTTHRVINPKASENGVTKARLSMPLFLHPHSDVKLSDRYPTAEGYRQERFGEIGLSDK